MAITHERIAVTNAYATRVTEVDKTYNQVSISIQNLGEGACYLGGSDVSDVEYGISIVAGGAVTVDNISATDELFVIHQDSSTHVAVLRVSR